MGAFSQIGQTVAKADDAGTNVRVHVKIPSDWGWETPSLWFQGDPVTLEDVGEQTHITGWGESDYGYPLTKEADDFYTGVIKGNVTNLQFLDVSAPTGRVVDNAYDVNMAQFTENTPQDLYYFKIDVDGDGELDTWRWYKDSEKQQALSEFVDMTLYYYDSNSWEKVYCHTWGNGIAGTKWPGTLAEQVKEDWYKIEIKSVPKNTTLNCIFNNNNKSQTETINISIADAAEGAAWIFTGEKGVVYTEPEEYKEAGNVKESEEPQITTCDLTLHYKNAYGENPAVYMYSGSDQIAGS